MAGLIFFTMAFLFMKNDRELDPDYQKNWWTLHFSALPLPDDLSFVITNHTPSERFTYTLKDGTTTLETQEVSVPKGSSRVIVPASPLKPEEGADRRIRQEITAWPSDSPEDTLSLYQK